MYTVHSLRKSAINWKINSVSYGCAKFQLEYKTLTSQPLLPQRPALILTSQNLVTWSSVGADEYSLYVSSRLLKQFMKYRGNSIRPGEWMNERKVKVSFLYSAAYAMTGPARLQSRKWQWQLIGKSQWCCSANCGHPIAHVNVQLDPRWYDQRCYHYATPPHEDGRRAGKQCLCR